MGLEDTDHIIEIEEHHENGHKEQQPSYSHIEVGKCSWCFVGLIEFVFVVDMICSHFVDQSIVGGLSAEVEKAFRLIRPEGFWSVTG